VCKQPVNLLVQKVYCFAEGSVLFDVVPAAWIAPEYLKESDKFAKRIDFDTKECGC
jgi:hypothetical protein